jgi:hypothetical protein
MPATVTGPIAPTAKYPWEEWTDGQVWEIIRGEDFDILAGNMAQVLRSYGIRKGLKVTTRRRGDVLAFQFRAS